MDHKTAAEVLTDDADNAHFKGHVAVVRSDAQGKAQVQVSGFCSDGWTAHGATRRLAQGADDLSGDIKGVKETCDAQSAATDLYPNIKAFWLGGYDVQGQNPQLLMRGGLQCEGQPQMSQVLLGANPSISGAHDVSPIELGEIVSDFLGGANLACGSAKRPVTGNEL